MNNTLSIIFVVVLGIYAFFTGEVVTFVMLGIILLSLNNINATLKKIYLQNKQKDEDEKSL